MNSNSKSLLLFVFASLLLLNAVHAGDWSKYTHTLRYNASTKEYKFSNCDDDGVIAATAIYDDSYTRIGWDYVHIEGNDALMKDDKMAPIAYHGMGFAEGYLTHEKIWNAYNNSVRDMDLDLTDEQRHFIQQQMGFVEVQAAIYPCPSMFHAKLAMVWHVVKGMFDGYKAANKDAGRQLEFTSFYLMSFQAEIDDVCRLYPGSNGSHSRIRSPRGVAQFGSAIIRNTGDDLLIGHNTWSPFSSMVRQYKTYKFGDQVTISMTSYPASLSSIDDWYTTSNGLAIAETTNAIFNITLLREFMCPESIPEFLRVMAATAGGRSGREWVDLFSYNNSGTYNGQFMIVDMKMFAPGKPLMNETLWVAEQLPGSVTSADVTGVLRKQGYWASYNTPYFENVYVQSGTRQMEEAYGSFYSYARNPRANIFAARQGSVRNFDDLKYLMRYNNYKNDPLSEIPNCKGTINGKCDPSRSPMLSIAGRGDLAPLGNATTLGPLFPYLSRHDFGAIDAKITAWSQLQNNTLNAIIICGPTTQDQPVFQWSKSSFSHTIWPSFLGMADKFDFKWVNIGLPQNYAPPSTAKKSSIVAGIVVGSIIAAGVAVAVGLFVYNRRKEALLNDENRPITSVNHAGYQPI